MHERGFLNSRALFCSLELVGFVQHFDDLRHTFAALQIKNNQSLAYIRDQLGHSSIKVTVDLYGHIKPGDFKVLPIYWTMVHRLVHL